MTRVRDAPTRACKALVGLLYDRIARRVWCEKAAAGAAGFTARRTTRGGFPRPSLSLARGTGRQVAAAAGRMDEGILRMAETEFDLAKKAGWLPGPRELAAGSCARSSGAQCYGDGRGEPARDGVRRPRAAPIYAGEETRECAAGPFSAGKAQVGPGLVQRPGCAECEVGQVPQVTSPVPGRVRTPWGSKHADTRL